LELLPLGRDELVATIGWIERYADQPMDFNNPLFYLKNLLFER
jgi:hypothetical protein